MYEKSRRVIVVSPVREAAKEGGAVERMLVRVVDDVETGMP